MALRDEGRPPAGPGAHREAEVTNLAKPTNAHVDQLIGHLKEAVNHVELSQDSLSRINQFGQARLLQGIAMALRGLAETYQVQTEHHG